MNQRATIPALRRSPSAVVLIFAVVFAAVGVVTGQPQTEAPQEGVPQIEPRYTQVFASDTVDIMFPRVSPDGRWIVYSHATGAEATAGLRLVSVKGGDPIELTSGNWDTQTRWFPTSDRIVFQSNSVDGLMTMAIDPETGATTGPAKRLTLEPSFGPSPVSPDGQWIAYRVWATEGAEQGMALKIIPARGGNARTVVRLPRKPQLRAWSRDGRHLYFMWSDTPGTPSKVWRVAVDGGDPEVVEKVPTGSSAPDIRYRLVRSEAPTSAGDVVNDIQTPDGKTLARVALPREMWGGQFTSDGRYLMTVIRNSVSPLRILPVAGGAMRQLGDARANDMPIGWTPDGERVIYQTRLDGRVATMAVPVEGGAAEEYTIIPDLHTSSYRTPVVLSESGRYIAFTASEDGGPETLKIARVSDGEVRQVTDSAASLALKGLDAPGGLPTVGDEFLYMEARGDRKELRITSFEGPSRLIRSFPLDLGTRTFWGVYGNRVAWTEAAGDSVAVVVADGPDAPVRRLALVDGLFDDVVWSPDSRWIAASFYKSGSDRGDGFKILLIPMTPDGQAASAPRYIDTQIGVGWGIRWLPDSQALTVFAQSLPDYGTDVWFIPIRDGGQPVAITQDENSEFWYYQLSPDGRYIAYQGEIQRGSSLWMIDLGDALASSTQ
jgi:Tol biopolymer transport system component